MALATGAAAAVLTVRTGGAEHAAMAALRILAAADERWTKVLARLRGAGNDHSDDSKSKPGSQLEGRGTSGARESK